MCNVTILCLKCLRQYRDMCVLVCNCYVAYLSYWFTPTDVIVRIVSILSKKEDELTTTAQKCFRECYNILWDFSDTPGNFVKHLMNTCIVRQCIENLRTGSKSTSNKVSLHNHINNKYASMNCSRGSDGGGGGTPQNSYLHNLPRRPNL